MAKSGTAPATFAIDEDGVEGANVPIVVDWEGEDDAEKATNWSVSKKWVNVLLISTLTLISPFGSSMFAPSTSETMREFHSTNVDLKSFSVSIFVLGYAFGPLLHGPLSELYGRLILYHVNSLLFILANVACALSVSLPMLIVFRLITGLVGSCPLAIGPASVSDLFVQEERGKGLAVWNLPVLLGPAIGPLVGSYLSAATGWRWDFWFLAIAMGAIYIATLLLLRETHSPTLLEWKARRLRKKYGNPEISSILASKKSPQATFLNAIVRPTRLLVYSPIILTLSICAAVNYGFIYIIFTTMTSTFMSRYGLSHGVVGLTYLGFGIGNIVGNVTLGALSDKLVKAMARKGEMKPEYRLPPLIPGSLLVPIGLFLYGWTLQYNVHFMVPLAGTFLVGVGTILIFMSINSYLVDAFTEHAASAVAASTVLRSLGGGLLPLCGGKLYEAVGDGWGNSILGFVGVAFIPAVWLLYRFGERLRLSSRV
ncbi:major facilitator superfamily domain-containing protein [Colletotrichum godetiae]|uniref:Major facilitator superfamily domain-containing protein n=1 Tax=Colletotrichum godetiae TaxID=1209918 RepID=A0AAJ0AVT9_9PEZI|nr:major facilitator superfamily domain-containing protein [Colletotrichum godetiae]KAK1689911.1 major facilitator superfamily domain-containing protein [Colletotrichum godetiae]